MNDLEKRAIDVCIDIYNDFSEEEIEDHLPSIQIAWGIGSEAESKKALNKHTSECEELKLFSSQDFK